MVYGTYNYSIHGVYKPTYNWGASHCGYLTVFNMAMENGPFIDYKNDDLLV